MGTVPVLYLATNTTGTNITIQLSAPTNATYSNSVLSWRLLGSEFRDTISTSSLVSGSYTIPNLTTRRIYEVWATPVLSGGSIQSAKSQAMIIIPTAGSIREQVLDYVESQVKNTLTYEETTLVAKQIQFGMRQFEGKFRGIHGSCLIDGRNQIIEPYTNAFRRVRYIVDVSIGWQDRRRDTREDNLGDVAERLRLLLDAGVSIPIDNIIQGFVTDIPFDSDVFDIGQHIRGFSLRAEYTVQEPIESN
jgi:hypothetical protein